LLHLNAALAGPPYRLDGPYPLLPWPACLSCSQVTGTWPNRPQAETSCLSSALVPFSVIQSSPFRSDGSQPSDYPASTFCPSLRSSAPRRSRACRRHPHPRPWNRIRSCATGLFLGGVPLSILKGSDLAGSARCSFRHWKAAPSAGNAHGIFQTLRSLVPDAQGQAQVVLRLVVPRAV